ncbi:MAG: LLM class flavin-dependent oxidoreductase [Halanaerobiales bacterium]
MKSISNEIKSKIIVKGFSVKEVANELEKKYKKKYSPQNLSNKLRHETISYKEIKDIAEIIGYQIKWEEI